MELFMSFSEYRNRNEIGSKMFIKQFLVVSSLVAGFSHGGNWKVDPAESKINFSIQGIFGTVHGHFSGLQATIHFNEKDLSKSSLSAYVQAKTVSTGISLRNRDLRNKEEWLNTEKYPTISFKSEKIEKTAIGYRVIGKLTIKGIERVVEIPFTFIGKASTGIFKGSFTIQRLDYKLGKPGGSVGNTVTIELDVPVNS